MAENLSREEEQRGWRRIFLWAIPLALVFGVGLVLIPLVANQSPDPSESGMDEITSRGPVEGKQALGPAILEVKSSAQYGQYLTDRSGRPLYLFKADTRGGKGGGAESKCDDACAKAWPPLLTDGQPQAASPASSELLGTLTREDGSTQVTYNGWPLYLYVKDVGPQEVTGHDIEDFGAEWYLVAPSGEEAHARIESG